jgi:hypothetical protein
MLDTLRGRNNIPRLVEIVGFEVHTAVLMKWFFYVRGYNAVQFIENQQTFRKDMSPPTSVSENKPSKKPA